MKTPSALLALGLTRTVLTTPASSVNNAAIPRPILGAASADVSVKSRVMIIPPDVWPANRAVPRMPPGAPLRQEPPRPPQRPRRHKEPRHQGVRPESVLPVERRHDARHHDALGGTDSMTYSEALTDKRTKPPCRCNGERKRARIIKLTYGNTADPAAKRYSTLI